jgi:hypothetical protein
VSLLTIVGIGHLYDLITPYNFSITITCISWQSPIAVGRADSTKRFFSVVFVTLDLLVFDAFDDTFSSLNSGTRFNSLQLNLVYTTEVIRNIRECIR